ncbi:MAG: VUT family protein [Kiritimatiellae bacterium]|nr:VUT family protein [Kiritimatiellia bacterium]
MFLYKQQLYQNILSLGIVIYSKMVTLKSLKDKIQQERVETAILLRSIPTMVVTLFVVSVICMNLLANKTIFQNEWIAIDGGFLISWLAFLCMDTITMYFGPKASTKIAILATSVNLLTCMIFYIASVIPSSAADYTALNNILGGTWFILLGSTIAFLTSAAINNFLNWTIGKGFKQNPNGKLAFIMQCYVSTIVAQFCDNLIFSLIVFVGFAPIFWNGFHWTILQCITCSLAGAILELIIQIVFSPISYKILKGWRTHAIGTEYLSYINKR